MKYTKNTHIKIMINNTLKHKLKKINTLNTKKIPKNKNTLHKS